MVVSLRVRNISYLKLSRVMMVKFCLNRVKFDTNYAKAKPDGKSVV